MKERALRSLFNLCLDHGVTLQDAFIKAFNLNPKRLILPLQNIIDTYIVKTCASYSLTVSINGDKYQRYYLPASDIILSEDDKKYIRVLFNRLGLYVDKNGFVKNRSSVATAIISLGNETFNIKFIDRELLETVTSDILSRRNLYKSYMFNCDAHLWHYVVGTSIPLEDGRFLFRIAFYSTTAAHIHLNICEKISESNTPSEYEKFWIDTTVEFAKLFPKSTFIISSKSLSNTTRNALKDIETKVTILHNIGVNYFKRDLILCMEQIDTSISVGTIIPVPLLKETDKHKYLNLYINQKKQYVESYNELLTSPTGFYYTNHLCIETPARDVI